MHISQVKPRCFNNHYSNSDSQGALICQSKNWPLKEPKQDYGRGFKDYFGEYRDEKVFNNKYEPPKKIPEGAQLVCAYSDRISQWDYARYERANKIAGTGCQGWAQRLPNLDEETLKRFAAVALNLEDKEIWAVRCTHWFNVSNGYSCPTVEAIYLEK